MYNFDSEIQYTEYNLNLNLNYIFGKWFLYYTYFFN